MPTVNMHEAKTNLSKLVERAAAGEDIVIARAGVPVARLVPVRHHQPVTLGLLQGRIRIAADFDAPLPDDVQRAFDGLGS
ncbi:MAG TPA: type II toxin-antitoxin system Phd/YefM family antitoxin [Sporichthyaceae bacterium]|jgi:prevent-host-death family protein